MCVLTQWHDMIYWCIVANGHEIFKNERNVQLNQYNKYGKALLHADFGHEL